MCGTLLLIGLFFFFQAEDGIRDVAVTGVQTCALPISLVFVAPISPRSTTSPGAVGRPGARRNIIHIASIYVLSRIAPLCGLLSSSTNPVPAAQACRMISEALLVFVLSREASFP